MANGFWPAVSGSKALDTHLETVANNLANVDTAGFKRDEPTFKQYIASQQNPSVSDGIAEIKGSPNQLYPLDGKNAQGVKLSGMYSDFRPGKLVRTANGLDVALTGPGFFQVATPQGTMLTRAGNFKMNQEGNLVTVDGYLVQPAGTNDGDLASGINLSGAQGSFSIASDGTISSQGQVLGKIAVKEVLDPLQLKKQAGVFFRAPAAAVTESTNPQMEQGFIETSNVNPVKELTELMKINRAFEATQKAVKTMSDLESRAVMDLSKL